MRSEPKHYLCKQWPFEQVLRSITSKDDSKHAVTVKRLILIGNNHSSERPFIDSNANYCGLAAGGDDLLLVVNCVDVNTAPVFGIITRLYKS